MDREKVSVEYATIQAENFLGMLEFNGEGFPIDFSPKGDWELESRLYEFTLRLSASSDSVGLFMKLYPAENENSRGYAERAYETLMALSQN